MVKRKVRREAESKPAAPLLMKTPNVKRSCLASSASLHKTAKRVRICIEGDVHNEENSMKDVSSRSSLTGLQSPLLSKLSSFIRQGHNYAGYCPLLTNDWTVPRVGYASLKPQEFFNQFVLPRRPCILECPDLDNEEFTKVFTNWCNSSYLKSVAGKVQVEVEVASQAKISDCIQFDGAKTKQKMFFGDLLDRFKSNDNNHYYMTTQPVSSNASGPIAVASNLLLKTGLADDFPTQPALVDTLVPYQINLWIGSCQAGTSTESTQDCFSTSGLHHDYHDNLYVMIQGRKKVRLYSPLVAECLSLKGQIAQIHPNGLICYSDRNRSDGADIKCVKQWRGEQINAELIALRGRLDRIEDEIKTLTALKSDCPSVKKKKLKKKRRGSSTVLTENTFNNVVRTLASQTAEARAQLLECELKSRQQSAKLVREYIERAQARKHAYKDHARDKVDVVALEADQESALGLISSLQQLENSLKPTQKKKIHQRKLAMKTALQEAGLPDNFCYVSTLHVAKPHEQPQKTPIEAPSDVLKYFLEVDLGPTDMLYIPASWFHEMLSTHDVSTDYHCALNYWFYPPNAPDCSYTEPYEDEYWVKRFRLWSALSQLPQQLGVSIGMDFLSKFLKSVQNEDDDDDNASSSSYSDLSDTSPPEEDPPRYSKPSSVRSPKTSSMVLRSSSGSPASSKPYEAPRTKVKLAYGKHMQLRNRPMSSWSAKGLH